MLYNPNPHCSVVRFGRKLMAEILFHGYSITKICDLVRVIQTFCSNLTFPELTSCKKLDSCLWHAASARSRLLLMADLYSTDCVRCLRSTSNWWTCVAIHTYVMHNERKTWERNDSSVVAMLFWWFVHHVSMQRPLQTLGAYSYPLQYIEYIFKSQIKCPCSVIPFQSIFCLIFFINAHIHVC